MGNWEILWKKHLWQLGCHTHSRFPEQRVSIHATPKGRGDGDERHSKAQVNLCPPPSPLAGQHRASYLPAGGKDPVTLPGKRSTPLISNKSTKFRKASYQRHPHRESPMRTPHQKRLTHSLRYFHSRNMCYVTGLGWWTVFPESPIDSLTSLGGQRPCMAGLNRGRARSAAVD